jgi:hypothetical protein
MDMQEPAPLRVKIVINYRDGRMEEKQHACNDLLQARKFIAEQREHFRQHRNEYDYNVFIGDNHLPSFQSNMIRT